MNLENGHNPEAWNRKMCCPKQWKLNLGPGRSEEQAHSTAALSLQSLVPCSKRQDQGVRAGVYEIPELLITSKGSRRAIQEGKLTFIASQIQIRALSLYKEEKSHLCSCVSDTLDKKVKWNAQDWWWECFTVRLAEQLAKSKGSLLAGRLYEENNMEIDAKE